MHITGRVSPLARNTGAPPQHPDKASLYRSPLLADSKEFLAQAALRKDVTDSSPAQLKHPTGKFVLHGNTVELPGDVAERDSLAYKVNIC